MPRTVDRSSALVGVGGALLFVSLFLDWFGGNDDAISAWTLFESVDVLLALLALAAVAIAGGRLDAIWATGRTLLPVVAGVALVFVAVQLIDPPPLAADADREIGPWIALVATLLMSLGAAMPFVKLDVRVRETRRRTPAARARPDEPTAPHDPTVTGGPPPEPPESRTRPPF